MIFNYRFVTIIKKILSNWKVSGKLSFTTVELIKKYQGCYYNANTTPNISINSEIGRFLKANRPILAIEEIGKNISARDDLGRHTTCSEWNIL